MHLEDVNTSDAYFNDILENILRHVPEFETDLEKGEQYMIMYEFGLFLLDNIGNEAIFRRCMDFINESLDVGTSITQDVIALELFQQLYDNSHYFEKVRDGLSKNSRIILDYFYLQFLKSHPTK